MFGGGTRDAPQWNKIKYTTDTIESHRTSLSHTNTHSECVREWQIELLHLPSVVYTYK